MTSVAPASAATAGLDVGAVRVAVAAVTDPEYPDLTIEQLGMLERVRIADDATVIVELVPTVLGCPALRTIEADVVAAVGRVTQGATVEVRFLAQPAWTPERIAPDARTRLAREYTITIRAHDGTTLCPVCGSRNVTERSAFGPTVCRSIAYCADCRNPVEVIRR